MTTRTILVTASIALAACAADPPSDCNLELARADAGSGFCNVSATVTSLVDGGATTTDDGTPIAFNVEIWRAEDGSDGLEVGVDLTFPDVSSGVTSTALLLCGPMFGEADVERYTAVQLGLPGHGGDRACHAQDL